MKLTLVLLFVGLVCAVYAQDAAKDVKDAAGKAKADLPDAPKLDKDAVTTPDPKDAQKKVDDAAGKAKDAAAKAKDDISGLGKKLQDGFKL
ncbi:uncharacterized protein LOC110676188 [Aedes aegypti]|uniref:Uncharacterized protein n=2 Tax=Stegomyia TaxID=53541 RepID=A0A6I8U4K2_AEDAE|nr:uncharacterized protein LOC109397959 [Aedes albopictus]XP_019563394.1 uncharacterized protein LOC109431616 [Aedes albopictus]XP_021698771.1 uncharacterized protein LOC110676188 [Aedes aegypti]XP_029730364.1 uncharacterized protein LOC115267486 [Aedes albopictus]XP_029730468.1 uncharacterized protein LOC115267520 [Aedes albopictus]KXJ77382.1 hypothetical protein RP20_CCG007737 [Aedes albopictus]